MTIPTILCITVPADPYLSMAGDEQQLSFDGAAGVQVGSGNVQINHFYGIPGRADSGGAAAFAAGPEDPARVGHAFISYVREDSVAVDELQRTLVAAGIPVWRDTASLWPGEDWRAKIRDAIVRDALVFIACFSVRSAARRKSFQNEELLLAIDQLRLRRPDDPWLIPVRFDHCEIPDLALGAGRTLASIQRADLFGPNRGREAGRLVAAVKRLLQESIPAMAGQPGNTPAERRSGADRRSGTDRRTKPIQVRLRVGINRSYNASSGRGKFEPLAWSRDVDRDIVQFLASSDSPLRSFDFIDRRTGESAFPDFQTLETMAFSAWSSALEDRLRAPAYIFDDIITDLTRAYIITAKDRRQGERRAGA